MSTTQRAEAAASKVTRSGATSGTDLRAALAADHDELGKSLGRLLDFVKGCDPALAYEEWGLFEPGVLRHLDAEEMFLLPAFEGADAVEAKVIRSEHAQIRKMLGEVGLAFELHLVEVDQVEQLASLLRKHVARETISMYAWADSDRNRLLMRSMLRRMGKHVPASPDDAVVTRLVRLLQACRDGERGYRRAATDVQDEGYRLIFQRHAAERAGFADVLAMHLQKLGASPALRGTMLGAAHCEWLNVSAALAQGGSRAILRECQRGDEAAMKMYAATLRAGLPPDVQETAQEQQDSVRNALREIEALLAMKEG